jgi:hypothetical protein
MTTLQKAHEAAPLAWLPRALRRWYLQSRYDHYLFCAMSEVESARAHNDAAKYYLDLAAQARSQLAEGKD